MVQRLYDIFLPPEYEKRRSTVARPTGATGVSGRAGWPTGRPIQICPPCGGTARSGARPRARRARQKKRDGARPRPQPRRLQEPAPHAGGSTESSPAFARDERQRHDNIQVRAWVAIWTDAPPILSDRGPGLMTSTPCAHGWRSRTSRPSFRPGSGARTPSPAPRTRRATSWNGASAGSNADDAWPPAMPYAQHCLGFLYWATAWIWLKSKPNTTWIVQHSPHSGPVIRSGRSRRHASRCFPCPDALGNELFVAPRAIPKRF